jgi:hypothetical protein
VFAYPCGPYHRAQSSLFAMLTYNLLVTIYLAFVGLSTEFVGVLL